MCQRAGRECFLALPADVAVTLAIQNLLYDVSQVAIPFDNVDASKFKSRNVGIRRIWGAL